MSAYGEHIADEGGKRMSVRSTAEDAREATLALLARRAPDATICPSEVARALATDWRTAMPAVHTAVDRLVREGSIRLSWKGAPLMTRTGPYRIGRQPRG